MGPVMARDFPQIEAVARMYPRSISVRDAGKDQQFELENTFFADSTAQQVMGFEFIQGDPATAFEGKNLDGATVKFPEDFKGKVVMIDFWATWCGPCMAEVPHIADAYKKFSGEGLEVLGVTIDKKGDASKVKQTISNKSMSWVHIHDADSAIAKIYKVTSIPRALLVDGDTGLILAEGNSLRGKQLEETIEKAIQAKKKK